MKTNDGGRAFPRPASIDTRNGTLPDGDDVVAEQDGMTLRDYFAAAALSGYLAWSPPDGGQTQPNAAAEKAYQYADAMLRARGQS